MTYEDSPVRLEELFAPDNNGALSYFYASNRIISNPLAMADILRELPDLPMAEQQKILKEVCSILEQVSTNSYALYRLKQPIIIDLLIDLIPNYVDNYLIFSKLLLILDQVLKSSSTSQKLVEKCIKKLITQLHSEEGQIENKSIFSAINILKSYWNCKINMDKEPDKMIVFHGGNGLQIQPTSKKQINWLFSSGFSIYFWVNIENIKFGAQASLPKFFTFYSPNNGGLQCYLIDNKIYYRTIGSKYNSPKIGSNGICLGEIEPKKWNFIGIQHEGPKRILGRSHITFVINDKKSSFNLSPPGISSKQKLKIVFFDKIYCKSSSICIRPWYEQNGFAETLNKNKNSIDLIRSTKMLIFEQRQGCLYERNDLGYCPDPILHRDKQMNFEGMLPLFHIYKFAKFPNSYPILNELLSLFVLFLYKSPLNQVEAHKKNYLHIISELIKSLPNLEQKFNEQTVNTLLHIKQTITNQQLLKQYHGQLMWGFVDSKISISSKQMLLQIVKNNFTQNVSYFSSIIGLDQMINIIMKLATKSSRCCEKHFKIVSKRIDKNLIDSEPGKFGEHEQALEYVLRIVELEIQNEKVNAAQQIYKLCRVLSIKFSPCFTLSFLNLIRKVMNEKLNEKLSGNQAKKIMEFLMSKKIYLMFIHVIQTTFLADIKAQCVRIIYSLLMKRASVAEQQEISSHLSRALWKINEDDENTGKIASHHSSPQKQKYPADEEPIMMKRVSGNALKMSSISSEDQESGVGLSDSTSSKNKASSIFKQVGPQAPPLTNKMKGSKTFSFNFMSEDEKSQSKQVNSSKQISPLTFEQATNPKTEKLKKTSFEFVEDQIMEQQKTNEPEQILLGDDKYYPHLENQETLNEEEVEGEKKGKKKFKGLRLNIDTDAINDMYTFGGEKGQQIMISAGEQQAEINKIRKLAKICLCAMRGQPYQPTDQGQISNNKQKLHVIPPLTTSNKVLRARTELKLDQLKHIEEESEPESTVQRQQPKKAFDISIPSPHMGSKKSKSPTSMTSMSQQNLIVLYNSLMESCVTAPNYDLIMPSIMYIFFSWIPETNLEVKFLYDLGLIFENDPSFEKMRTFVKMPELYDFLFQLTYKALLFEQMGDKRLYTQKLEEIVKKIFAFIFREEPQSLEKFTFIIDWCSHKSKEYHPRCLFLASRYIFFLLMDAIEEDLFTNSKNDKLMERNFQCLGIAANKFIKFLPTEQESSQGELSIHVDEFDRIVFDQDFSMIPSIAPYFTSPWVDYLICQKYYILFKKFFCTDWYNKNLKIFENYLNSKNQAAMEQLITNSLTSQLLILSAESQYYMKNSFIFTLMDINRMLFVEKMLKEHTEQTHFAEKPEIIWQTLVILLFAESTKDKNQKNNSEFVMSFLKNCKIFCSFEFKQAAIIIPLLKCIRDTIIQGSTSMTGSGIHDGSKDSRGQVKTQFAQFLIESYINQNLLDAENVTNFQNFKLNFREVWIPGENHETKIKSEMHTRLIHKYNDIEEKVPEYIEHLSNFIEEETQRANSVEILVEASNRQARSSFRKLWRNLRVFGTEWTHPQFSLQNNTLFNKSLFTYERLETNKFYRLRICKHMSKYRMRYFLKPILFNQPITESNQNSDRGQIGLSKALIYYSQGKLVLGNKVISWIFHKNQPSHSFRDLQITMSFKKVRLIKTLTVRHGYLGIINDKLIFINSYYKQPPSHLAIAQYKLKEDKNMYKMWPLEYIKELFKRRYVNRKRAIEINFIYGKSIMLEFYQNDHEDFIKKLVKLKGSKCPNLIYNGNKTLDAKKIYESQGLFKKWSTYEISNFQYLMELNNLAGRSYCDLTQYPVVPWVVIGFENKFTLSEENNYRNLALPMGALGSQQRTQGFMQRFENMAEIQQQRFHYGTHYSSPAIIYHFLVRLSPFTEGAILLQSGKFDFADRLFFSIMDSYKNATSEYSDVRELIPEMYTFPESYMNINKLDLGVMQNQKRVHNVELPAWARQNSYLYVTKIRRALEEMIVSKNISKWIDLIFGFKQRGEQAINSLNCYVHLTYEDSINFQELKDSKTVKAIETQILNFGQTPSQLFTKAHQQRVSPLTMQVSGTICDPDVEPRIYRPSRHSSTVDLLKEEKQQFNVMRQSGDSMIHMRWFKDSRLVFIRRNGQLLFYKWHPTPSSNNKIPFQCAIEKEKVISKVGKSSVDSSECLDPSLKTDTFPIEFINNGHHIALGGMVDGRLLMIDADTNAVETYTLHQHTICCVKSDLKENFLITGDIQGNVIVWRIINGYKLTFNYALKDHYKQITSIFVSYDVRCLFTSSIDGAIYGYNIITSRKMKVLRHPKELPISNVIVSTSPLPVILMFCNPQSIIYCYSINGQLIQRVHEKDIEHFLSPILIRDTFGFEHVAYGDEHGGTIFRALPYLDNPVKHVVAKDAAVNRLCLSKSSRFVIVGCSDGELSVITAPDQQTLTR